MRSGGEFGRRLDALDRAGLADLLARLCAARGSEVTVEDGVVVARGPYAAAAEDGATTTRYLAVPSRGWLARVAAGLGRDAVGPRDVAEPVDVVVSPDPALADAVADAVDARAWGPRDLLGFAAYAIDRTDAAPVVADVLDASLDDLVQAADVVATRRPAPDSPTNAGTRFDADSRADDDAPGDRSGVRLVVVAAVLVAAIFVVVGSGVDTPSGSPALDAPAGSQSTGSGGGSGAGAATASPAPDGASTPDGATAHGVATAGGGSGGDAAAAPEGSSDVALAPGITSAGVVDADVLAAAHGRTVATQSYRWELTYVETRDDREVARATERVRVASPARYVSTVNRTGDAGTGDSPISWTATYGDGRSRWVRSVHPSMEGDLDVSDVRRQPLDDHPGGVHAQSAEWIVQQYLDTNRSRINRGLVRDSTRLYVVGFEGSPNPNRANYSGTAVVTEEGMVPSLYVTYRVPDEELRVWFTYSYRPLDSDLTAPPAWVPWWSDSPSTGDRNATAAVVRSGPTGG